MTRMTGTFITLREIKNKKVIKTEFEELSFLSQARVSRGGRGDINDKAKV